MAMQIELSGVITTVTKEQLYVLAKRGQIQPETIILVDGKRKYKASQIKDISFGDAEKQQKFLPVVTPVSQDSALPQPNIVADPATKYNFTNEKTNLNTHKNIWTRDIPGSAGCVCFFATFTILIAGLGFTMDHVFNSPPSILAIIIGIIGSISCAIISIFVGIVFDKIMRQMPNKIAAFFNSLEQFRQNPDDEILEQTILKLGKWVESVIRFDLQFNPQWKKITSNFDPQWIKNDPQWIKK